MLQRSILCHQHTAIDLTGNELGNIVVSAAIVRVLVHSFFFFTEKVSSTKTGFPAWWQSKMTTPGDQNASAQEKVCWNPI